MAVTIKDRLKDNMDKANNVAKELNSTVVESNEAVVDIVSQVDRTEARVHIVLLFVVYVVVPDFPI